MHVVYPVVLAALLFSVGVYGVLARRNAVLVLMSVELMLGAVTVNLVVFDMWVSDSGDLLHGGQVLTLFVIAMAAAEVGMGLAITLLMFRDRGGIDVDRMRDLAERDETGEATAAPGAEEMASGAAGQASPEPEPPEGSRASKTAGTVKDPRTSAGDRSDR